MKTKTFSLLSLAAWLLVSGMFRSVNGQESGNAALSSSVGQRALQYFERSEKGDLDDYLKSIRPTGMSPDQRARFVASIKKEDVVSPSAERQAKLDSLRTILAYHDRAGIEVKILRLGLA